MIRSIDHLSKLAILELHMHALYHAMEREAGRILQTGGDGSVTTPQAEAVLHLARKHGAAEFEDLMNIQRLLTARVLAEKVRKLPSALIRDEIRGNFLALRQSTKRQELLLRFELAAEEDGDAELKTWLRDVSEEEKRHELALGQLAKLLDAPLPLAVRFLSESEYRVFLAAAYDAIFGGAEMGTAVEALQAVLAPANSTDHAVLVELLRVGSGIYWSYCVSGAEQ